MVQLFYVYLDLILKLHKALRLGVLKMKFLLWYSLMTFVIIYYVIETFLSPSIRGRVGIDVHYLHMIEFIVKFHIYII